MRAEQIIKQELAKIKNKKDTGNNIFICCPYHNERTPSFGINLLPNIKKVPLGYGHCFSCGAKANWNQIAEKVGLQQLKNMREDGTFPQEYAAKFDAKIKNKLLGEEKLTWHEIEKEMDCLLSYPVEKENTWRGISGKLLNKIGCLITVDRNDNKCLFLPTIIDDEIVGVQKALWEKKKGQLSYVNYRGEWIKKKGLFPYDYTQKIIDKKKLDYVVLVEGARDALKLLTYKIPALAILGTNNWDKQKLKLIQQMRVKKVYLMMDADEAGVSANKKIYKECQHGIETKIISLKSMQEKITKESVTKENAWDAASMPENIIEKLKRKLEE